MKKQSISTPFSDARKAHFPGLRFTDAVSKQAGRIYKVKGEAEALRFLEGKGSAELCDAKPPVKCRILAQSRPFAEWPLVQLNNCVQTAVYKLRLADYELLRAFKPTAACREMTLHRLGIVAKDVHAQALNKIIPNALAVYGGVLLKVENLNAKKSAKAQRSQERSLEEGLPVEAMPEPKSATDVDGYLIDPPGVNPCLSVYQRISPVPVMNGRTFGGRFAEYARDPDAALAIPYVSRKNLTSGQYGHIPDWQVPQLNPAKSRRRRAWWCATNNRPKPNRRPASAARQQACADARDAGALLCSIRLREDWILFDARALLQNAAYRGLTTKDLTLTQLLEMFTGEPIVDTVRGIVTMCYCQGIVPICKRRIVGTKKSPELLSKLTTQHGSIGLVSVDLGQTNPIAARIATLIEGQSPVLVKTVALPEVLRSEWSRYRSACDTLEAELKATAIATLTEEQQAEIAHVYGYGPADCQKDVLEKFGVDLVKLSTEKMSSGTYFIADCLLRQRPEASALVHFTNKKKRSIKRNDFNIYKFVRPKVSQETREALQQVLWQMKRESPAYRKLSQRKLELSRRCANWLVREARRSTQCETVVMVCEDLHVRMFHGSGKRDIGWNQFFIAKRENRWLIPALHKALTELAPHQGVPVVEVNPARTSSTCPKCGHCDPKNRDGEAFECLSCGARMNTDFDVATANIERVAVSGAAMPRREYVETEQKGYRAARNRRNIRKEKEIPEEL